MNLSTFKSVRAKACAHVMAHLIWVILTIALISKEACLVYGDIGSATSYGPPYIPTNCGGPREDQFPPGNLFVAVSDGLGDNGAACGRRYRVRCLNGPNKPCRHKTIEVKVVDFCPITPCPSTIILSQESFAAVAQNQTRKINVEYLQV